MVEITREDLWMILHKDDLSEAYIFRHTKCGKIMEWFPDADQGIDLISCPYCNIEKVIDQCAESVFDISWIECVFNPYKYKTNIKDKLWGE